jgi:hypothetical protein
MIKKGRKRSDIDHLLAAYSERLTFAKKHIERALSKNECAPSCSRLKELYNKVSVETESKKDFVPSRTAYTVFQVTDELISMHDENAKANGRH